MKILHYTLVNEDKVSRAINGSIQREGVGVGGVGEHKDDEGNLINGLAILTEYDRLGGLIKKGKYKVKTGSFFDFKTRKPRAAPNVLLVMRDLMGDEIEIEENEPVPVEVRAAEQAADKREAKAKAAAEAKAAREAEKKKKKKAKKNGDMEGETTETVGAEDDEEIEDDEIDEDDEMPE